MSVEVVAHRAGNSASEAAAAVGYADRIELDVHVLRGRVEVRHAKVLHPTRRLWEKWYLLPRGAAGVAIEDVLAAIPDTTPLMVDLKCFTLRSSRKILAALPVTSPLVVSTRNWWVLKPFKNRPNTQCLRSCGARWQLWWVIYLSRFADSDGVCVHERLLSPVIVGALLARTERVFTWGVETLERADELAELGVAGIIADDYVGVR